MDAPRHDCTGCYRPIPAGKEVEVRGLLYCVACVARDPRKFAAAFGREITGRTAHGYRSRKARKA